MKDDIVHRLELWVGDRLIDELLTEAANEIKYLRALLLQPDTAEIRGTDEDWFQKAKFKKP